MPIQHRPYRDDCDLQTMLDLVSASARHDGAETGHLHQGDVVWGLFQHTGIVPADRVRLFEDAAGALLGFVWRQPPDLWLAQLDTSRPVPESLVAEMAAWAEPHQADGASDPPPERFATEIASTDAALREALQRLGYAPTGSADYQLNVRDLAGPVETAALPAGATVRPVDGDDHAEVAARVALHREVWEPSKFDEEGFRRLRDRPVYRPDLDLVAVTPDGGLAAYCIVWWDPETRVGEFEPVGTSTRHRRQGYARALLLDGLRRLQGLGAEQAVVISSTSERFAPSRALYAALGFRTVLTFDTWERPSTADPGSTTTEER